jgi:hypothetical protein
MVAVEVERQLALRDARPEWQTVEEYAAAMRTTPAAVHKRLERGRIAGAVRDGRRWLIPVTEPATVLASNNEGRAPQQRPRPGNRR